MCWLTESACDIIRIQPDRDLALSTYPALSTSSRIVCLVYARVRVCPRSSFKKFVADASARESKAKKEADEKAVAEAKKRERLLEEQRKAREAEEAARSTRQARAGPRMACYDGAGGGGGNATPGSSLDAYGCVSGVILSCVLTAIREP